MSIISASTLVNTALQYTADTTGTLVFKTGATPTTALTIGADQSATFAGTVNFAAAGFTSLSLSGNLTFTSTGNRITGDFTNATISSRVAFQTSTANSTTGIYALPSGTSTAASWQATNAADPTNASKILIATNGSTDVQLVSGRNGTGTYLPLTFYTNGAEQMRINTSGILCIGTASTPSGTTVKLALSSSAGAGLQFINTTSSNGGAINCEGGSGLVFFGYTGAVGSETYTERMRIDSSGNLSIGTATAIQKLTVVGNTHVPITYSYHCHTSDFGMGTPNSAGLQIFKAAGDVIRFGNRSSGTFTEQMRLDASGNLGIGDNNPPYKLSISVSPAAGSGDGIQIFSGSATSWLGVTGSTYNVYGVGANESWLYGGTTLNIGPYGNYPIKFVSNGAERMRITPAGTVGIGTSTVTYGTLQVNGAISAAGASGFNSSTFIVNSRNPIWYFGNAQAYGISYFQATAGIAGNDCIGFHFGNATASASQLQVIGGVGVTIVGSLSKSSGSFRIDHPLPQLEETHQLVHSFVEAPMADLIYRGVATLVKGKATVNIDEAATMTEGTFEALCRTVQCFTTNESDWVAVRGKVVGNILTIEAQDPTSTANISWMVIGERKDKHMLNTGWTDENGRVIVEPLKPATKEAEGTK